jgi:hypothetical protein
MHNLKPMDAVSALYTGDNHELSSAIVNSLSQAIFEGNEIKPAGKLKQALAHVSHRVMQWTTRTDTTQDPSGSEITLFSNRLLERSKHPYAKALLNSSCGENVALVEGGDPMNGPYMMISPEIRKNCGVWDRLFFDSVQSRDVQSRIIWETQATYHAAKRWLEQGAPVRLKAVAAGTGLSMMLVYDKLVSDGFDPKLITARITDRDQANINKANRLLDALARVRNPKLGSDWRSGITAVAEDIFASDAEAGEQYDVVTAIGILEYFHGCSSTTTHERLKLEPPSNSVTAHDLVPRLTSMASDRAHLIVNTYKDHSSTRILELFGKRFVYRSPDDIQSLLASADFRPHRIAGSGHIYDVKVYEKNQLKNQ